MNTKENLFFYCFTAKMLIISLQFDLYAETSLPKKSHFSVAKPQNHPPMFRQRRRKESRNNSPRLGRVISKTQSYNLIEHIFYRPKVLNYFQRFYLPINLTALPLVLFVSATPQYLLYKIIHEIIHWSVALVCNFPILLPHFELFQTKKLLYQIMIASQ